MSQNNSVAEWTAQGIYGCHVLINIFFMSKNIVTHVIIVEWLQIIIQSKLYFLKKYGLKLFTILIY